MAALTVAVSAVTWVILRCSRAAERSPASVAWLGGHHLLPANQRAPTPSRWREGLDRT